MKIRHNKHVWLPLKGGILLSEVCVCVCVSELLTTATALEASSSWGLMAVT